ncbi:MAG: site-2 protease family protein, partial [Candidatus Staskawiczbacteria bacterium]|nr:site-2 protease family protein [Candidatus Staskawiczbacteria bacterium]
MILILLVAIFSLVALMVIHEFGHFIIAKKFGIKVEEFGIGYPPRIFGKKFGETIYSINLLPLGAFVKIYGEEGGVDDYRSFTGLAIWKRILIVLGGVAAFWLAAIVIFSVVFAIGVNIPVVDEDIPGLTNPEVRVIGISENSPAEKAGLKSGDIILKAKTQDSQSVEIKKIKDFQEITKNNLGKDISFTVNRKGNNFEISLAPRLEWPENEGPAGLVLERTADIIGKHPLYIAPFKGAAYTWEITVNSTLGLFQVFSQLFSGKGVPQGAEFAGPLGITVFLARAADYGIGYFLYFVGVISVLVAIFNLFPIPALDGGKLVFLLIEKIRKMPVSPLIEQRMTVFFFILLI